MLFNLQNKSLLGLMFNLENDFFLSSKRIYVYGLFFSCHLKMNFLLTDLMDDLTTGFSHIYTCLGNFLAMLGLIEARNIEPFCFPADCGLPVQVKVQAMHCHPRRAACQVQFSQRTSIYSPVPLSQIPRTHSFQFSSCLF